MSGEKQESIELCSETYDRVVVLNNVSGGGYEGLGGDYRLLTGVFGFNRCVVYEAVSGNDRYPPGRNMHVELSFEELDALLVAFTHHKTAIEKDKEAKKITRNSGDDFDPFLDPDDLP
jgi:hypothetical protein